MTSRQFIFAILLEAPALAGASSHEPDSVVFDDSYIRLVRAVHNSPAQRSIKTQRGQFVVFPGDSLPEEFQKKNDSSSGLAALDYLSNFYEENDYYESGFMGTENQTISEAILFGPIPDRGFENFLPPVRGKITSGFGYRELHQRFHKGIDISLCVGDTIVAALTGQVERVGYERGGYGRFVIIKNTDGIETRYAHLQACLVSPGQAVTAGQPIALGGNTGNSTGPHLHFEVRYLGRSLDPRLIYPFDNDLR